MTTYVDSSALVAFYVTEPFSAQARRQISRLPQVPFTPLHDLEVRNAFRLLWGRRILTPSEARAVTGHLNDDLQAHRLRWTSMDFDRVFTRARQLSDLYSARLLCRSLDLLHVASAEILGCHRLISGDDRQLKLARRLRLRVTDITKPRGAAPAAAPEGQRRPRRPPPRSSPRSRNPG